jgi:hypothetical protein
MIGSISHGYIIYPPVNEHKPCQIESGRLVSNDKKILFSGPMFIYQRISHVLMMFTLWLFNMAMV